MTSRVRKFDSCPGALPRGRSGGRRRAPCDDSGPLGGRVSSSAAAVTRARRAVSGDLVRARDHLTGRPRLAAAVSPPSSPLRLALGLVDASLTRAVSRELEDVERLTVVGDASTSDALLGLLDHVRPDVVLADGALVARSAGEVERRCAGLGAALVVRVDADPRCRDVSSIEASAFLARGPVDDMARLLLDVTMIARPRAERSRT